MEGMQREYIALDRYARIRMSGDQLPYMRMRAGNAAPPPVGSAGGDVQHLRVQIAGLRQRHLLQGESGGHAEQHIASDAPRQCGAAHDGILGAVAQRLRHGRSLAHRLEHHIVHECHGSVFALSV